jgi:hypothetical protein
MQRAGAAACDGGGQPGPPAPAARGRTGGGSGADSCLPPPSAPCAPQDPATGLPKHRRAKLEKVFRIIDRAGTGRLAMRSLQARDRGELRPGAAGTQPGALRCQAPAAACRWPRAAPRPSGCRPPRRPMPTATAARRSPTQTCARCSSAPGARGSAGVSGARRRVTPLPPACAAALPAAHAASARPRPAPSPPPPFSQGLQAGRRPPRRPAAVPGLLRPRLAHDQQQRLRRHGGRDVPVEGSRAAAGRGRTGAWSPHSAARPRAWAWAQGRGPRRGVPRARQGGPLPPQRRGGRASCAL